MRHSPSTSEGVWGQAGPTCFLATVFTVFCGFSMAQTASDAEKVPPAAAEDAAEMAERPTPPTEAPAPESAGPSITDEAIETLRSKRREVVPIEPTAASEPAPSPPPVSPPQVQADPADEAILGAAPSAGQPLLRREGEFVFARRGRVIQNTFGQALFQFDADSRHASEPPMVLLPCRLLEHMESVAHGREDQTVFVLTGQVFVYRGANHLLPTMAVEQWDKGNLQIGGKPAPPRRR